MTRRPYGLLSGFAVLVLAASAPAQPTTYPGGGFAIPDNNPTGASNTITVPDGYNLGTITVNLDFATGVRHTFFGDVIATLQHGTTTVDLFRRVGKFVPDASDGDSSNLFGVYTFTDTATNRLIDLASTLPGANDPTGDLPTGNYRATTNTLNSVGTPTFSGETIVNLNGAFGGQNVSGAWTLTLADVVALDVGTLGSWSITLTPAPIPEPSALALCGIGAAWFAVRRRRRAQTTA